jgi:hypothetical protein
MACEFRREIEPGWHGGPTRLAWRGSWAHTPHETRNKASHTARVSQRTASRRPASTLVVSRHVRSREEDRRSASATDRLTTSHARAQATRRNNVSGATEASRPPATTLGLRRPYEALLRPSSRDHTMHGLPRPRCSNRQRGHRGAWEDRPILPGMSVGPGRGLASGQGGPVWANMAAGPLLPAQLQRCSDTVRAGGAGFGCGPGAGDGG